MLFVFGGALVVVLSVVRVATGWAAGPPRLLPEFTSCVLGTALGLWGWSRLRRAKAGRPDLSWRQFLRRDLITLGIAAALIAGFAALTPAQRDELLRTLREYAELLSIARGP
jgi:hypothetical protein